MPLPSDDLSTLRALEDSVTGALTLSEGLDQHELARAPLTARELRRQLLDATAAVASLTRETLEAMPELDAAAWQTVGERLGSAGGAQRDACWFALQALAPATLGWLRFYRAREPELFAPPGS